MAPAVKTILFSQLCFYVALVVCMLLRPAGLATNDGISYYGTYGETILPYAIGLFGAAFGAIHAAGQLPPAFRRLRLALKIYAPLIAGIVITPYAAGEWMDYVHTACGSALFFLQLVLSAYLVWRLRYVWWSITLCLIELASGILSGLFLDPKQGLLLQTQTIFQLAFGSLLIVGLQHLIDARPTPAHDTTAAHKKAEAKVATDRLTPGGPF